MTRHTVRVAAGIAAALGLLTACNSKAPGTAEPPASSPASAPSNSSTASGGPSAGSGPKVPAPLSTQALLSDPCSALGDSDATGIGLAAPGRPFQGDQGAAKDLKGCQWVSAEFQGLNTAGIVPLTPNKNGISDIYAQKNQEAYFEVTTLAGYPAVHAAKTDDRANGHCELWVGVTDQLAVSVSVGLGTGQGRSNPCGAADKVGTAMVNHLKTAS